MSLETLQKEARGRFIANNLDGAATLDHVDDLVTHVYSQTIEDAKGAIRKEELVGAITRTDMDTDETTEAPAEIRSAYNAALEYAVQAVEALTKD